MNQKYTEVRKVSWDSLWHAVYTAETGHPTWDRIPEDEALRIARQLPPRVPPVPLVKRNPRPLARDFPRLLPKVDQPFSCPGHTGGEEGGR